MACFGLGNGYSCPGSHFKTTYTSLLSCALKQPFIPQTHHAAVQGHVKMSPGAGAALWGGGEILSASVLTPSLDRVPY